MTKAKKKIVIVEDDADTCQALKVMLETLGHDVVEFRSAKGCLDSIEELKVDAFLLDIMMPEMNGYELLEKLRQTEKFKTTPVIMVTAKDQESEVLEGYQHGADYYITKPFTAKQLEYGLKMFIG